MKKDLSVLMLLVRNSFWRVLLAILMIIIIDGVFLFADLDLQNGWSISLEELLKNRPLLAGLSSALFWLTYSVTKFGSDKISKEYYTLLRLQISEGKIWFWQALYHTFCYLFLFVAEIAIFLFLRRYYVSTSPVEAFGLSTVLKVFSTNHYLQNLIPYHNPLRWFRNMMIVVGLGITSATEPFAKRRGIIEYLAYPQLLLTLIVFNIDLRFWLFDLLVILLSGFWAVKAMVYVKKGVGKIDS